MGIEGTHLDPNARSVWVDQFQLDTDVRFSVLGPKGWETQIVHTDDAFIAKMVDSYRRLSAEGDRVTVLKEHKISGEHFGTVHDVRIDTNAAGQRWFQTRTSFTASVWEAYDDDRVVEFSPGFVPRLTNPHTGEVFENVLLEVSITSMALQHTLRPPQATNASRPLVEWAQLAMSNQEQPMTDETKAADESQEDKEPTMEEMKAKLAELEKENAALKAAAAEKDGEVEAVTEEKTEASQLAASLITRVKELENANTRLELSRYQLPDEEVADLVELKRANAALYQRHVARLSKAPTVQASIGSVGNPSTQANARKPVEKILEEAKQAGKVSGDGSLSVWCFSRYPEQYEEVMATVGA